MLSNKQILITKQVIQTKINEIEKYFEKHESKSYFYDESLCLELESLKRVYNLL